MGDHPPVFILHTAAVNWTHGQNGRRTVGKENRCSQMGRELREELGMRGRGVGIERERSWE